MREHFFLLLPTPPVGLRPRVRAVRRDVEYLTQAKNVRASQFGIEAYSPATDPFGGAIATTFPFPQYHRGMGRSLLFGETSISDVDESGVPWLASAIQTYDPEDVYVTKAIPAGGEWHIADLPEAFYAFNGNCVVFKTGLEKLDNRPEKVFVQDSVTINTGCAFRGRIITGGFDPTNIWNLFWQGIFQDWQDKLVEHNLGWDLNDIGQNWVMWSSIGGSDFPLWLFFPPQYHGYESAPTADRLLERMLRNELGWMPMPFQGQVHRVLPLRNSVIVYGDDGIVALRPIVAGVGNEMPATFGTQHVSHVGIPGRSYAFGFDDMHVFIDHTGALWQINGELQVAKLGYEEFLYDLLGVNTRITYDPQQQEFRLCSSTDGFLLNGQGLFQHHQRVVSGTHEAGGFIGTFENDAAPDATEAIVVTQPFDMTTTGLKMVTFIGVDARYSGTLHVAVDYRYHRNDAWSRTPWIPVNKELNVRAAVTALEFRIAIRASSYTDFELDRISVGWQRDDKRTVRGADADPSFTGAG